MNYHSIFILIACRVVSPLHVMESTHNDFVSKFHLFPYPSSNEYPYPVSSTSPKDDTVIQHYLRRFSPKPASENIYWTEHHQHIPIQKWFHKRKWLSIYNQIRNKEKDCLFCHGTGFIRCRRCSDSENGCYVCEYSGLERCPFCSGNGKRKYAFLHSEIKKTIV